MRKLSRRVSLQYIIYTLNIPIIFPRSECSIKGEKIMKGNTMIK